MCVLIYVFAQMLLLTIVVKFDDINFKFKNVRKIQDVIKMKNSKKTSKKVSHLITAVFGSHSVFSIL